MGGDAPASDGAFSDATGEREEATTLLIPRHLRSASIGIRLLMSSTVISCSPLLSASPLAASASSPAAGSTTRYPYASRSALTAERTRDAREERGRGRAHS
jgi:hypothetical protein